MDKPAIPYVKGAQLTLYHRIAPEPTPRKYGGCTRKEYRDLKQYTPLQYYLLDPPLTGTTITGNSLKTTITDKYQCVMVAVLKLWVSMATVSQKYMILYTIQI
jgi:hypothetical protein